MKRDWLHVAFEDKFATLCQPFERVELGRLFFYILLLLLFLFYDQLLIKQQLIMIFWKWVQISNNSIQGQ